MASGSYLHTEGSATTTWNVAHNLNVQYCAVEVFDSTDKQVIPDTITFTDSNNLVITFSTATAGKARVVG